MGASEIVRPALRVAMSLLVIVIFLAIGAFVGFLFSLSHVDFAFGGGHGGSHGVGAAYQDWKVFAAGALGVALGLAVTWGMWRNSALSRWFAATSVFAFSLLLAVLIRVWQYPGGFVVAALIAAALSVAYIYAESKGVSRGSSNTGA